jgi:hypothetical protein
MGLRIVNGLTTAFSCSLQDVNCNLPLTHHSSLTTHHCFSMSIQTIRRGLATVSGRWVMEG